jgi:hypothetical protein
VHKFDGRDLKILKRRTAHKNLYGIHSEERMKQWITKNRICVKNLFFKQCLRCANKGICDGVYPQYAAEFGSNEFIPVGGEPIRDPLYYRKKNQMWRMMKPKKTGAP